MRLFKMLLVFLINFPVNSQNWHPVPYNTKLNYLSNSDHHIYTIYVDSIFVSDNNTTLSLNKVIKMCDTCINLSGLTSCDSCFALDNQPQFLQSEIIEMKKGDFLFKNPHTFLLKTQSGVNAKWIFDTTSNIDAEVINIKDTVLFGVPDSLKVIKLSTNDTIELSKKFGLNKFSCSSYSQMEYRLVGIQNSSYGIQVPGINEIFNFNVGDIFQYYIYEFNEGIDYPTYTYFKYIIDSRNIRNDSLIYGIKGIKKGEIRGFPPFGYFEYYVEDTLYYVNSKENQVCDDFNTFGFEKTNLIWSQYISYFDVLLTDTGIVKTINTVYKDKSGNEYPRIYERVYGLNDLLNITSSYDYFSLILSPHIGIVKEAFGLQDWIEHQKLLQGYIKNGDTTGYIMPEVISGIFTKSQHLVRIYPNPVENLLFVQPLNDLNTSYEILDTNGRILKKEHLLHNPINIAEFKSGLYFIKLMYMDMIIVERFVKK